MMNKKASIRNRIADFADTLRGKNVDKAREALSGATSNMQDQLQTIRNAQKRQADLHHEIWGEDGHIQAMDKQYKLENPGSFLDTYDLGENPQNYSSKMQELGEAYSKTNSDYVDTIAQLKGGYLDDSRAVVPDLSSLQSDVTAAEKATNLARLQAAAGLGTVGMAGAYGLGRSGGNKKEAPGSTKLASVTTEYPYLNMRKGR